MELRVILVYPYQKYSDSHPLGLFLVHILYFYEDLKVLAFSPYLFASSCSQVTNLEQSFNEILSYQSNYFMHFLDFIMAVRKLCLCRIYQCLWLAEILLNEKGPIAYLSSIRGRKSELYRLIRLIFILSNPLTALMWVAWLTSLIA